MSAELFLLGVIVIIAIAFVVLAFRDPAKPAQPDDGEYWIRYTWNGRPVFLAANKVTFVSGYSAKAGSLEITCCGGSRLVITAPAEIDAALDALGLDRSEVFAFEKGAVS